MNGKHPQSHMWLDGLYAQNKSSVRRVKPSHFNNALYKQIVARRVRCPLFTPKSVISTEHTERRYIVEQCRGQPDTRHGENRPTGNFRRSTDVLRVLALRPPCWWIIPIVGPFRPPRKPSSVERQTEEISSSNYHHFSICCTIHWQIAVLWSICVRSPSSCAFGCPAAVWSTWMIFTCTKMTPNPRRIRSGERSGREPGAVGIAKDGRWSACLKAHRLVLSLLFVSAAKSVAPSVLARSSTSQMSSQVLWKGRRVIVRRNGAMITNALLG